MNALISSAAVVLAMAAGANAQSAGRDCSVTHHQCYPACVQMTPDGSDCAKTREVCRDICGAKPTYPSVSNTEAAEIKRFEYDEPAPTRTPEEVPDTIVPSPYPYPEQDQ
jgi:hypothetical protein